MKTFILLVVLTLMAGFISTEAPAHPGGTDSSGCHVCRTNCEDWGLNYGEYHCH